MKQLMLVRHAQTADNQAHRLQGQRDTALSETGLKQARRVAAVLQGETFDEIWCSPLYRAKTTAEHIQHHHHCSLNPMPELLERNFGELEGQPLKHLIDREARWPGDLSSMPIPGGETLEDLYRRAGRFWQDCRQMSAASLLIVGHAGFFRALIGHILDLETDAWFNLPQANTCIHTFRFDEQGQLTAWQLNEHSHCE